MLIAAGYQAVNAKRDLAADPMLKALSEKLHVPEAGVVSNAKFLLSLIAVQRVKDANTTGCRDRVGLRTFLKVGGKQSEIVIE